MMSTLISDGNMTPETPSKDWYESDLQLAAELGKTLLERNKELEGCITEQESVIDDQDLEIQYLTKQVVALREINDSRLKVYEQLESTIAELERKNSKLCQEKEADRKLIKSLTSNVDALEKRCDDLQDVLNELRSNQHNNEIKDDRIKNSWARNLQYLSSDNKLRRVISCENRIWGNDDDSQFAKNSDAEMEIITLHSKLNYNKSMREQENKLRNELESQLSTLIAENEELREKIRYHEHKEQQYKNLEYEMQIFEESYGKVCRNCQQRLKINCGDLDSPTSQFLDSDVEPDNCKVGDGTLVRLSNGSQVYGSAESLLSLCNQSTGTCSESQSISLLSELDAQYKALIDKYESLVNAQSHAVGVASTQTQKCSDGDSGINLGDESAENLGKGGATETLNVCGPQSSLQVRLKAPPRSLNLNESSSQINCHFQRSPPEYKRLFQEIFAVLKKNMEADDASKKAPKVEEKKMDVVQCSFGHWGQLPKGRSYADVVRSGMPRRHRQVGPPPKPSNFCSYKRN